MANIVIYCENCLHKIGIEKNWLDSKVICPYCEAVFVATKRHRVPKTTKKKTASSKKSSSGSLGLFIKKAIILLIIAAGAFFLFQKFFVPTPESLDGNELNLMTRKRMNRDGAIGAAQIAEHDLFPVIRDKEDFFYRTCGFANMSLREKAPEEYVGSVVIYRNKKEMTRPVYVDRRGTFTKYDFSFNYKEHPGYLEEDADLIFELACQIDRSLKKYKYISAKVSNGNILTMTVADGSKSKDVRVKVVQVTGKDMIRRVWLEFLN